MAMVKAKFRLFQMQIKGAVSDTVKFLQSVFGMVPEGFYAVDTMLALAIH